eukprot:TRINITY_DN20331_c0_g1_i2.p1 TRINITY_DN20331_c0_g1~~TRINITY_DN20331_c0_g1_i2.p1  ORF type:complete len:530 (+),score=59.77 TRINITY_DN20331_c0_g1_i2:41-1630(+)
MHSPAARRYRLDPLSRSPEPRRRGHDPLSGAIVYNNFDDWSNPYTGNTLGPLAITHETIPRRPHRLPRTQLSPLHAARPRLAAALCVLESAGNLSADALMLMEFVSTTGAALESEADNDLPPAALKNIKNGISLLEPQEGDGANAHDLLRLVDVVCARFPAVHIDRRQFALRLARVSASPIARITEVDFLLALRPEMSHKDARAALRALAAPPRNPNPQKSPEPATNLVRPAVRHPSVRFAPPTAGEPRTSLQYDDPPDGSEADVPSRVSSSALLCAPSAARSAFEGFLRAVNSGHALRRQDSSVSSAMSMLSRKATARAALMPRRLREQRVKALTAFCTAISTESPPVVVDVTSIHALADGLEVVGGATGLKEGVQLAELLTTIEATVGKWPGQSKLRSAVAPGTTCTLSKAIQAAYPSLSSCDLYSQITALDLRNVLPKAPALLTLRLYAVMERVRVKYPPEVIEELVATFAAFGGANGFITFGQLHQSMRNWQEAELRQLFDEHDTDRDGTLDFEEFAGLVQEAYL